MCGRSAMTGHSNLLEAIPRSRTEWGAWLAGSYTGSDHNLTEPGCFPVYVGNFTQIQINTGRGNPRRRIK